MLTCAALAALLGVAAAPATSKAPSGSVFGGATQQDWPIVVTLDKARTQVRRVVVGLDMTCTSGDHFSTNDGFQRVKLSGKGRFSAKVGPERIDAGGSPADVESKVIGRMAKDRATMRGVWSLKVTFYDAAAANVADTCESGLVAWTAAQ